MDKNQKKFKTHKAARIFMAVNSGAKIKSLGGTIFWMTDDGILHGSHRDGSVISIDAGRLFSGSMLPFTLVEEEKKQGVYTAYDVISVLDQKAILDAMTEEEKKPRTFCKQRTLAGIRAYHKFLMRCIGPMIAKMVASAVTKEMNKVYKSDHISGLR